MPSQLGERVFQVNYTNLPVKEVPMDFRFNETFRVCRVKAAVAQLTKECARLFCCGRAGTTAGGVRDRPPAEIRLWLPKPSGPRSVFHRSGRKPG